jgi:hypothetical protein
MKNLLLTYARIVVSAVVVCSLCGCKFIYQPYTGGEHTVSVETLRITGNDISGWSEPKSNGFNVYVGDELYHALDGGAPTYLQKGLIETSIQTLQNGKQSIGATVMDFGISANAEAMYEEMKSKITDPRASPSFGLDDAVINPGILGGCLAYAHFDNFYFEMYVSGFQDKTLAIQTADIFLKIYKSKCGL